MTPGQQNRLIEEGLLKGMGDRVVRRMCGILVGISLAVSLWVAGASNGQAPVADGFCGHRLARNYAAPLFRMPAMRAIPTELPFAPRSVEQETPTTNLLVPGQTMQISYWFRAEAGRSLVGKRGWEVNSELVRVNGGGRPIGVVARKNLSLLALRSAPTSGIGFSFSVGAQPRFYAVETEFRRPDGKILQRYGEYFRVVSATRGTTLVVSQGTVHAGDEVRFRVKNSGTLSTAFGEAFYLEKEVDNRWFKVRLSNKWHAVRLGLGAGEIGKCQRLVVPSGLGPGRYRVQKELIEPPKQVTAEIFIVP